jgi:serine/threonine protein kinase
VVDMFMTWEADAPVSNEGLPKESGWSSASALSITRDDDAASDGEEDTSKSSHQAPPTRYLCIVMEYMDEGTLEKAIKDEPNYVSKPLVVISMLRQIIAAIAFSHRKNLIHRDLKPGNVLLSHDKTRAVLTDFGLARDLDQSTTEKCGAGTLPFLAPEQMDHRVSKKSDIWSIACIGVAMATAPTSKGTRAMFLLRSEAAFEDDIRAELHLLPQWLQDLLIRMLQAVPLDRPTADECLIEFDLNYDPSQMMFSEGSREASDLLVGSSVIMQHTIPSIYHMQRQQSDATTPSTPPTLLHPNVDGSAMDPMVV